MKSTRMLACACLAIIGSACAGKSTTRIPPVANVEMSRFMGDWYVIASIPSFPERHAYAAVETYALRPDGRVQTTFRYRNGSFDSPIKTMHPIGTVRPGSGNAVWGMQFIWPIQAEYVIVYLAPDYSQTIIGRSDRDYAWVMARTPQISAIDYQANLQRLRALGYRLDNLRQVPQPPAPGAAIPDAMR